MEFTVTARGSTLEQLTRDTVRALRQANRRAGRDVAKVGKAAMGKGAPTMWGRKLAVKAKVNAWPDRCEVTFTPAPKTAGGWAIQESGRRGGYTVKPRTKRALRFGAEHAMVTHPGAWGGRKAWTKAGDRLAKALDDTIRDVYDDALEA